MGKTKIQSPVPEVLCQDCQHWLRDEEVGVLGDCTKALHSIKDGWGIAVSTFGDVPRRCRMFERREMPEVLR